MERPWDVQRTTWDWPDTIQSVDLQSDALDSAPLQLGQTVIMRVVEIVHIERETDHTLSREGQS